MTEHAHTSMPTSEAVASAEEAVRGYLATWNATDEHARGNLLRRHWSPEVAYTDPLASVNGHNELDAAIAGAHEQFPGMVFSLVGEVDAHHGQLRFRWGLGPAAAEPVAVGFDVIVLDADGLIKNVYGFLDQIPTPPTASRDRAEHAAYVIAHLRDFAPHSEVADYIERVAGTFEPFHGKFLVHGTEHEVKEGTWPGNVVLLRFPSVVQAQAWWESPAYRQIAPLRARHIPGDIILVPGVPQDYDPAAMAQALRRAAPAQS